LIIFCHLLNDRSGSPKVLASVISTLIAAGESAQLFIGSQGSGCLDEVKITTTRYWYKRSSRRLITLFTFFFSQLCLFLRLLRSRDLPTDAVIYINTLLPFGAALFGAITRRPVLYHLHEVSITPAPLRWFLVAIARLTAKQLIYVSDFHRKCLPIKQIPSCILYNTLDSEFAQQALNALPYQPRRAGSFRILMLASLRDYKGVPELLALAQQLLPYPDVTLHLVANDDALAIERYFADKTLPTNLTVYPRTNNPAQHYAQASLVLNLSRPDQWQETFGLTLLEAMAYGIPVVAPPIGGPVELISDGCQGFLVDCRDHQLLLQRVKQLIEDHALCMRMSAAARAQAAQFSAAAYATTLHAILTTVRSTGSTH